MDPNPESALNEEAGKLLQEDRAEYDRTARLFTEVHGKSNTKLFWETASAANPSNDAPPSAPVPSAPTPSSAKSAGPPKSDAKKKALKRL
jgi:ubiquitin-conjugating enzyme E2 S